MNWHHDSPVPLLAASHAMSAPFGSPDVPLFSFPTVHRKKVVAAFDGGRITSDGGVMLLGAVERQLGIADTLARLISDPRNPALVTHGVDDILRARILAISCGYEDADDLDVLRTDPGFKVACGRLPDSGDDLCSQPTVSRWENAPTLREVVRMTYAMIDVYCRSYAHPPAAVTFDIDDTCDVAHGNQQLALFHAHYDERCFLPIHVYDAANARPVVVVFRPGKTPSGEEVRSHLRRMVRRIRGHWPDTRITVRGDSHYGRREVMAWCEANGLHYIFGLSGNAVEMPAARCRPHRGHAERSRHPLRRDQPGWRQRGVALRDHVLRARPDGKLHQTAQDPASFRPHQLPLTARQSGAARAAHRRLLAVAEGPRQHPETAAARHRRVQDHSDALDQDRRADYRNRLAGPCRLRRRLPRSQSVQRPRPLLPTRGTMTAGACAPEYATSQQPQRLPSLVRFRDEKGAWGNYALGVFAVIPASTLNKTG